MPTCTKTMQIIWRFRIRRQNNRVASVYGVIDSQNLYIKFCFSCLENDAYFFNFLVITETFLQDVPDLSGLKFRQNY